MNYLLSLSIVMLCLAQIPDLYAMLHVATATVMRSNSFTQRTPTRTLHSPQSPALRKKIDKAVQQLIDSREATSAQEVFNEINNTSVFIEIVKAFLSRTEEVSSETLLPKIEQCAQVLSQNIDIVSTYHLSGLMVLLENYEGEQCTLLKNLVATRKKDFEDITQALPHFLRKESNAVVSPEEITIPLEEANAEPSITIPAVTAAEEPAVISTEVNSQAAATLPQSAPLIRPPVHTPVTIAQSTVQPPKVTLSIPTTILPVSRPTIYSNPHNAAYMRKRKVLAFILPVVGLYVIYQLYQSKKSHRTI